MVHRRLHPDSFSSMPLPCFLLLSSLLLLLEGVLLLEAITVGEREEASIEGSEPDDDASASCPNNKSHACVDKYAGDGGLPQHRESS